MKTKKRNGQPLYRQANKRWKWKEMAGATAATAAGVTTSQAGLVTINLSGNYISATGGNHLNADLTGDGHADLTIANASYRVFNPLTPGSGGFTYPSFNKYFARVELNGVLARARADNDYGYGYAQLGSQSQHFGAISVTYGVHPYASVVGSIPISFKDLHINGGALTKGSLEVTVFAGTGDFQLHNSTRVQLDSFTYNTPDQGSSLAFLAMGVGGILALRRWRALQAGSRSAISSSGN
jgi:hypothetical protein